MIDLLAGLFVLGLAGLLVGAIGALEWIDRRLGRRQDGEP
jgi:hypothetical protein